MLTQKQQSEYQAIVEKATTEMLNYALNNNLHTFVLGISGGIDSSVVAALAHITCQKAKDAMYDLSLVCMQLPTSSNEVIENSTATAISNAFGDTIINNSIDDESDFIISTAQSLTDNDITPIARGNIKARVRMILLYHMAQMTYGIVLGGANKTEGLLGFMTIHGSDTNDFAPIATLYKHQVYELAEYLKDNYGLTKEQQLALGQSIGLTPTDGNGVATGGDMAQIAPGYTYNEVDKVLQNLEKISDIYTGNKEVLTGLIQVQCQSFMDEDTVKKVCDRYYKNEFKRKKLPVTIDYNHV